MTAIGTDIRESDIDRVKELTSIGAGHAATALARLVGRSCRMRPPTVRMLAADQLTAPFVVSASADRREGMAGIFFEIEGGLGGELAFLFDAPTRLRLMEILLGKVPDEPGSLEEESALREVGNILASHMVSALADTLGVAVLPSIPILALDDAPTAFASLVAMRAGGGPVLRLETELHDRERDLRGLMVFVPDTISQIKARQV